MTDQAAETIQKKPARRTQAERSARTRQNILVATINCIYENGSGNTTLQRVARDAGVTVGAVQHYFLSKTELFLAVIDYGFGDLSARMDRAVEKNSTLKERIDDFIEQMWEHCISPTYQANIQILLDLQVANSTANTNWLLTPLTQFTVQAREIWMQAFGETPLSEQEHQELLHYVFASISGSAQLFRISSHQSRIDSDLELLKTLLLIKLS
jgi:AcrR family transcriptional regulator